MKKICIIGSGSWGTALGIHLANKGENVSIWSYDQEEKRLMNEEHKCMFLPNVTVPESIVVTNSYEEAIKDAELILHVTPSKFVRSTIKGYKEFVTQDQIIAICSKGLEGDTLKTLDEVVEEELPGIHYGVLSGPTHAEEVSVGIPTAMVVASKFDDVKEKIVDVFKNEKMRMYYTSDVKGAEIGGALKNIIAFCAGIISGLGYGDNTFAALLTRGLVEIVRLGNCMGADSKTFYGLTGLGDLIVTCSSEHSRNRRAGKMVGQGHSIDDAKKEIGMVIESIDNIDVAYKLAQKYNIEMPIVESVYHVLYDNLDPNEAAKKLMIRTLKEE